MSPSPAGAASASSLAATCAAGSLASAAGSLAPAGSLASAASPSPVPSASPASLDSAPDASPAWAACSASAAASTGSSCSVSSATRRVSAEKPTSSNVSDTSAMPAGPRVSEPAKITSPIAWPRRCLADCSPMHQRMASTMFDLPQPLGPTTAVTGSRKFRTVRSQNDLNPMISMRLIRMRESLLLSLPGPRGKPPITPDLESARTLADRADRSPSPTGPVPATRACYTLEMTRARPILLALALPGLALAGGPAGAAPRVSIRARTAITLDPVRRTEGGFLVGGHLIERGSGEPVPRATIEISIDGRAWTVATGPAGAFSADLPATGGQHDLRIDYPGSGSFDASSAERPHLDVAKRPVTLLLEAPQRHSRQHGPLTLSLNAHDDDGPVAVPVEVRYGDSAGDSLPVVARVDDPRGGAGAGQPGSGAAGAAGAQAHRGQLRR